MYISPKLGIVCVVLKYVGPFFSAIMVEDVIIPVQPTYVSFPKRTGGGVPCGTTFYFLCHMLLTVAAYEVHLYSAECARKRVFLYTEHVSLQYTIMTERSQSLLRMCCRMYERASVHTV